MAPPLLTKDHVLIAVDSMPGDWDTSTDPSFGREVTTMRRSADGQMEASGGRVTYEDITLTRFWDESRDSAIVRQFKANAGFYDGTTLSLTSLGSDGVPLGTPDTYTGNVKSVSPTGSDANSTDPKKLTVVLSIARGA
ncbi:MAG: hypothetical protein GC157_07195 [Frankiales bacterium]|nr:hypothetical protein [Frankiales bacterium]